MIHYIEYGDIFEISGVTSYAHGCNCAGAMGKGIALQFRAKFPAMYTEYKQLCVAGKFTPGDVYVYNYGRGYVFNLGTQATWRTKAKLEYIEKSIERMMGIAEVSDVSSIALPAIGAGLGGLVWEDVKQLLEKVAAQHISVDLYVVENYSKS